MSYLTSSIAGTNGHEAPERYEAESPFLGSALAEATEMPETFESVAAESPFLAGEGLTGLEQSGVQGDLHQMLAELYDSEFDRALFELSEAAAEAAAGESTMDGEAGAPQAEHYVREWLEPVHREAQAMLEAIGESFEGHDVASMTEQEVDEMLAPHEPIVTGANPVFENFLGGFWKKVKGAVNGAANLARRGIAAVGKLLPINWILDRLKALVHPLLERVLQMALDRLPPSLRPAAEALKRRLFGEAYDEADESVPEVGGVATTAETAEIQREFDLNTATLLFAESEAEGDAAVAEAMEATAQAEDPINALAAAREQFEAELQALPPGGDPQPAIEHFLPAVMALLPLVRMGISIIGRDKIVRFIAKYVAQMIGPYTGDLAPTLSQAIVSAGLGMLSLEAPVDPREVNSTVLAGTVEDTVRHVAEHASEALENPDLLEATVAEAFNEAAARNFPPTMIKPRHRHAWGVESGRHHDGHLGREHRHHHHRHRHGMWVRVPHTHGYKRYTRVLTAHITPSIAQQIHLFGGTTLAAFLRDRYGITGEVDVPVHLYEALHGTTLGRIAAHERRVRGLGHARAYWKLQPLTPEVAGLLLREPGLGHAVDPEYLARPQKIAVGERFYYLELRGRGAHVGAGAGGVAVVPGGVAVASGGASAVAGAPVVVTVPGAPAVGGPEAGRSSETNVRVNFPAHEIVVSQYLSDADAQMIATAAVKAGPVVAVTELRRPVHHGLKLALSSAPHGHLRWIVGAPGSGLPPAPGAEAPLVLADRASAHRVRVKVREWVDAALIGFVNHRRQEFVATAQKATHGVTLIVRLSNVPAMERLLAHPGPGGAVGGSVEPFGPGAPTVTVELRRGFHGA